MKYLYILIVVLTLYCFWVLIYEHNDANLENEGLRDDIHALEEKLDQKENELKHLESVLSEERNRLAFAEDAANKLAARLEMVESELRKKESGRTND